MARSDESIEAPRWRERLLPTTVLGMSVLVLSFAVGAAFSGTILYAFYEFRLDRNEERVSKFVEGFDERYDTAVDRIAAERENAKSEIEQTLEPLRRIRAEGETLEALARKVAGAVWFVRSLDEAGQPSVGSAFAVASDPDQTLLVASYETVRAATRSPGPGVFVRKGETEIKATVWTWHEERDLALLVIDRGNQPKLAFAKKDPPLRIGERLFAVSGLGAAGAAITQGFVADVSSVAIQHDAPVGHAFQGGPLINSDGEVQGIASRAYAPLGFRSEAVFFGVPARTACQRVLKCPSGTPDAAGDRR